MKEIWKDIEEYKGLYQISNFGRVKSLAKRWPNGKFISINQDRRKGKEYKYVTLCKNGVMKSKKLHRLIAQAFIPNPDNKPQINHINSVKDDNRLENLEWCTISENKKHSLKSKTSLSGELHPWSKLSDEDIKDIRRNFVRGTDSYKKLMAKYKVSNVCIYNVVNNKTRNY